MEHHYPLTVRFNECDMYGHVNHAVYLSYLENARVDWLEQVGLPLSQLTARGYYLYIVKITIEYKKPAVLGDELVVVSKSSKKSRIGGVFHQKVQRGGDTLTDAMVHWVCVGEDGRPTKVPEEISRPL